MHELKSESMGVLHQAPASDQGYKLSKYNCRNDLISNASPSTATLYQGERVNYQECSYSSYTLYLLDTPRLEYSDLYCECVKQTDGKVRYLFRGLMLNILTQTVRVRKR